MISTWCGGEGVSVCVSNVPASGEEEDGDEKVTSEEESGAVDGPSEEEEGREDVVCLLEGQAPIAVKKGERKRPTKKRKTKGEPSSVARRQEVCCLDHVYL